MHPSLFQYIKYAQQLKGNGMVGGRIGAPPSKALRAVMDASSGFSYPMMPAFDAATAGGMAFLTAELEKRDPTLYEPLTSYTWFRDIVTETGGGWVDYTSNFFVNYGISGPNQYGFIGNKTTQITSVQADVSKEIYPVTNWSNEMIVSYIDMQKANQVGRSLDTMYEDGIRANWNKSLDLTTYQGWGSNAGLLNNTNVTRVTLPNGGGGSSLWKNKTPQEILLDINTMLVNTWAAGNYDLTSMAVNLLIPPFQFGYLSTTLISTAGSVSILTYLLENNIAKTQGRQLSILPSRWCIGAGSGSSDRCLAYVNEKNRVMLDIPVSMQRVMTQPSADKGGAYITLFMAQIGVVKFRYFQPVLYSDGL